MILKLNRKKKYLNGRHFIIIEALAIDSLSKLYSNKQKSKIALQKENRNFLQILFKKIKFGIKKSFYKMLYTKINE